MTGFVGCILVLLTGLFVGFLVPYAPEETDRTLLYTPPQWPKIYGGEKGLHGHSYTAS